MDSRNLIEKGYTDTLDSIIVALCRDYLRRNEVLKTGDCSVRTAMEYKYINAIIYDAACEVVGVRDAVTYISEIGDRIGYASSQIDYVSESTYKQQKKEVKLNIARRLHLVD